MTEFWRWMLGLKQAPDWVSDGSWSLQFHSLPQGAWAVGGVLLALLGLSGIWYLYKTELSTVPVAARVLLVVLRTLVFACVTFMLLELVLVITKREEMPSRLLVLVDTSQSMGLSDPYPDSDVTGQLVSDLKFDHVAALRRAKRLDVATRALSQIIGPLSQEREVSLYRFSHQALPVTVDELASLESTGAETAIGEALAAALADHRGQPLAGVLLVTDGRSNAGADPRKVAEQAGKQGVPIVALAAASVQGPSNARLAAIEADPVVFVRDPTEVAVVVEAHGMQGRTGSVTLERRQDANWVEVGREEVTFGEDAAARRLAFKIVPEAIGELEFRARIADFGSELTESDNFATHLMKVVRQQIRVLLIAGSPSPEVQFLRNALLRDAGLEFACWLQTAGERYEQVGTRAIRRLPVNRQELEQYDAVILFDPDMRALGPAWPEMLSQFVGSAGGGLVYVAGEMHTRSLFEGTLLDSSEGAGRTIDNSWIRLLPVTLDGALYRGGAEVSLSPTEPWNLELTGDGAADPVFQFDPDPLKNRDILASLPGMYWHFPVTRPKPGATVLARHGDPRMRNAFGRHVLMATHRYGPGRTVFLAFDATYRWRYLHEEYFDGFWARVIDRVGRGKALGGRYPFMLSTDKNIYRTGDQITIQARAVESSEAANSVADLKGELELAGQTPQTIEMETVPDQVGLAQYTFTAGEAGAYSVRVLPGNVVAVGDTTVRPATLEFKVEPAHNELDRPKLDLALLEDMARASGGSVVAMSDYQRVPEAFKVKQVARTLEHRDELWDAPIVFGSLMLFLTLEWLLRKRARMA